MDNEEKTELIAIIEAVLPKTEHGHGLQNFNATIAPRHAKSIENLEGAKLLHRLGSEPIKPLVFGLSH